jgi:hypothetical protein
MKRSATVTVRLTPQTVETMRYAAGMEMRTVSSYIQRVVTEDLLKNKDKIAEFKSLYGNTES